MVQRGVRSNVVDSLSSLVGRQRELAALTAFVDGGARLVTLIGPGGVGKTRVATRLAVERARAYSAHGGGGVWWVDLTGVRTAAALCGRVAQVLAGPLDAAGDLELAVARLGTALARRARLLLVLDNCEHLGAGAIAAIGSWLARAPRTQVVATSRVPLELVGEQRWPLLPLEVPTADGAPTVTDAVTMFVERARALRPTLDLADALPVVARIVQRLGGLPLAIELAAARVRLLTPVEILQRLERPLDLLVRPGDEGRHGSIRRTVDDSLELCDAEARAGFAGCAVFASSFSIAAAEAVLAEAGRSVLDVLERLCAHSLLRVDRGAARLGWLEALREVALGALDDDPARKALLAARHMTYFAGLAATLVPQLAGPGAAAALATLTIEADELCAAHAHAVADPGPGGPLTALALALDPVLAGQGRLRLRRRVLDAAVAAEGRAEPMAAARVRLARAQCRREQADLVGAGDDLATVAVSATATIDPVIAARVDLGQGELIEIAGDTVAARAAYERALTRLVDDGGTADALVVAAEAHARLGHALRREGALGPAAAAIARAAAIYQRLGHGAGDGAMAYEAGVIALFARDLVGARRWVERARSIAVELGHRAQVAAARSVLGILAQAQGDVRAAIADHVQAVTEFRDLGNRHREGSALYYLAGAYLELDEPVQAQVLLLQAAEAVGAVGAVRYQALIAGAQLAALAVLGDGAGAVAALAEAERFLAACPAEPALAATIAIHACQLRWPAADPVAAARVVGAARALADQTPGDDPAWAVRLVARRAGDRAAAGPPLWIAADGTEVRVPGVEASIDLRRRAPLRRILLALVERRLMAPGEALTQDELVAAGWPGEYISHGAAGNRLHVALSTLRKLGLRPYIESGEHGYVLAPSVAIARG